MSCWRHQMEIFSALLAICAGNLPVTAALMFSLICAWINGWVNNRDAGDLRRHRAHYVVIAMVSYLFAIACPGRAIHERPCNPPVLSQQPRCCSTIRGTLPLRKSNKQPQKTSMTPVWRDNRTFPDRSSVREITCNGGCKRLATCDLLRLMNSQAFECWWIVYRAWIEIFWQGQLGDADIMT